MEDVKKLREQSVAELKSLHDELSVSMFDLKCENSVQRKLEKPHMLKANRRQKARILTILREKENESAK